MRHRGLTAPNSTPLAGAPPKRAADSRAQALLRLQRTAGNAAVTRLVGPRRLSRRRVLPADPTSLADYAAVRGEISLDAETGSPVKPKDLPDLFRKGGARFEEREGFDISYHYSKDIAAEPAKQDAVEIGLANIARSLFNLTSGSTDPATIGKTSLLNFDLKAFGGRDGRYRFTSVAGEKAKQVQILIEFVGPAPQALSGWDALGEAGQRKLTERFARFGFSWGDGDVGWANDKKAQVMQATALIPDAVLNEVSGISWERGRDRLGPDGEAGRYEFDGRVRRIILYTEAFRDDWELVELVAHELGHGLSYRPQERDRSVKAHADEPAYQRAAGPTSQAPTEYGRKSYKEDFAESFALFIEEPDTLKALRPDLFDYFTKLVGGLPAPGKASTP